MDYSKLKEFTDEALAINTLVSQRKLANGKTLVCTGLKTENSVNWWFSIDGENIGPDAANLLINE